MIKLIDIHCHILPGLDDGAFDLKEAVKMASKAAADGITEVIATPHTYNGIYSVTLEELVTSVSLMQEVLVQEKIALKIHPGAEVQIHHELLENLQKKKIPTLCNMNKYLLLELPSSNMPIFTDELLFRLLQEGYIPIIAHPERHLLLQEDLSPLKKWVSRGVLTQLTAGSLIGYWGRQVRSTARSFIERGLAQFIASDAHNAGKRAGELSGAYKILGRWASQRTVEQFQSNARVVLQGKGYIPVYLKSD